MIYVDVSESVQVMAPRFASFGTWASWLRVTGLSARRRSRWNLRFSAHINAGYNGLLAPKKKSQETWISRWFVDELFSKLGTREPRTSSGTTQDWAQLIMVVLGRSWCFPAAPCCWCRDWDESRRFDTQLGILASLAVELEKPKKLSCDVQAQTCFLRHLGSDVFLEGWNDSKSADIRQLRQLPVKRNPASQSLSLQLKAVRNQARQKVWECQSWICTGNDCLLLDVPKKNLRFSGISSSGGNHLGC